MVRRAALARRRALRVLLLGCVFCSSENVAVRASRKPQPCHLTRPSLATAHHRSAAGTPGAFPILKSKGADGQLRIEAAPDEHWAHNSPQPSPTLAKAGHLLVTAGQRTSTGRLTAVASEEPRVGHGWMPVTGDQAEAESAKSAAVFLNSTAGRLLLMRSPGRTLDFPAYTPAIVNALPVPDLADPRIRSVLAGCWEATRHMAVPQYRDGECAIRQLWDAAVCEALGWDEDEIAGYRKLLHEEPHVKGLGYGQYADEPDDIDEQDTDSVPNIHTRSRALQTGDSRTGLTRSESSIVVPEGSSASDPQN